MENKSNFNKNLFAKSTLQKFVEYYRKGNNILDAYASRLNLINNRQDPENIIANEERRKILENCRDLFKDISLRKKLEFEIEAIRNEMNTTKGREPYDSEIANWLIKSFSEELFGISKRIYDMSQLPAKDMLSTINTPQGQLKIVDYISFEDFQEKRKKDNAKNGKPEQENLPEKPAEKTLHDKYGNPIHIQFMGWLAYKTRSSNEYIFKHRITKTIDGSEEIYEKFSNIDIFALNHNKELCDIVVSELLSDENLNRSNADDYIGEIYKQKSLEPGNQKFDSGFYTYQINPSYALVYNGERIEAIRAYKQQEPIKKALKQAKSTKQSSTVSQQEVSEQPDKDDELEI